MNILVIRETNTFFTSSASNNRFLSLAKGLVDNGCNLDLMFLRAFSNNKEKVTYKNSGNIDGINYFYLTPFYLPNILVRKFFNNYIFTKHLYNLRKIESIMEQKQYDYIWLHGGKNIIKIALRLKKVEKGIKFIHEQSEFPWFSGLSQNKKVQELYLYHFLPTIDVFSIMTTTLIQFYEKYAGQNTKIIHLPMTVDFERFQPDSLGFALKKPYIGYCGTMSNKKDGVHILIQSFIKIMDSYPDLQLYLAGPLNPENDYLMQKNIISENKADKRIKYIGLLSKEEIPGFLKNANLLALARPKSKQAEGGFPTKLGEYLATGNPVCVTNVGEICNYLTNNESAYIAEPDSVDSFYNILRKALKDENANEIGLAGRKVAMENFNKNIQAKKLFDFLTDNN